MVTIGANNISIAVAEYVRGSGWKRQDKTLLQKTVEKVAAAVA